MQLESSFLVTIVTLVLFSAIHAQQVNPSLCPTGPIESPDPSWRPVPSRFEIMTELVADEGVMELSQAFSSQRDAITITARSVQLQLYWNFETNEQFEIGSIVVQQQSNLVCLRQVINPSTSETSVIEPGSLIVKPSVLLGYDARNQINPRWGVIKTGNSVLRGIPTEMFKSCFYLPDIKATVTATYQVSDVTKFQAYLPANVSIILEISVKVANENGKTDSYIYNVFRYTPNPSRQEMQQALETPSGAYCPNRINTLDVPSNIPARVSVNNEVFVAEANRSISSLYQLSDQFYQFARWDIWTINPKESGMTHLTEMHDFGTGLGYNYDHRTHHCTINELTLDMGGSTPVVGHPDLLQMSNGLLLFMEDDFSFQYTGIQQCRDRVHCHVWIGEKLMPNNTGVEHRESYWAFEINGDLLQQWMPMKVIVNKRNAAGVVVSSIEANLFNFRRNPSTIFEIDYTMADCYRAMGPEENFNLGVISFTVNNDREYPVQKNIEYLRYTIWQALALVLDVRSFRISNIIVDHDGRDLPVTFTLLDAPPRLGPVEFPLHEPSLTTVIAHLRAVIDSNALVFRAQYGTSQVNLRARINSLQVIYTSFDQTSAQCLNQTSNRNQNQKIDQCLNITSGQNGNVDQSIEITYKSSGPLITGFWIGFIILGLAIGIVGGVFGLKRCSK